MNVPELVKIAKQLMGSGKGLLAMDESTGTCNRRFAAAGIAQTEESRRAYRELIVTTPGIGDAINGAILFDETIRQKTSDGTPFVKALISAGIIPGIKVDAGAQDLAARPGEKITEGLDGLRERLQEYSRLGARFAKWRAVITIGDEIPSQGCIDANSHALARYAALCQEANIVPIVEPEVLMDGDHTIEQCRIATAKTLRSVFINLSSQNVILEGMILKPNMIVPGLACQTQASVEEIAETTVKCFLEVVPAAVSGIAFLSGGQSAVLATARLNAINLLAKDWASRVPWPLVFSFSRAIQQPALDIWQGREDRVHAAQEALVHRLRCNKSALQGEYSASMEEA